MLSLHRVLIVPGRAATERARLDLVLGLLSLAAAFNAHAGVTRIKHDGTQVTIEVQGGRPAYQLQFTPALGQPWTNVGAPTTSTQFQVPAPAAQGFFRVLSDYTALYAVEFEATWSAQTLPLDFPAGVAHFSGLVGAVHDENVQFWAENATASEGIRRMAELGSKSTLLAEVAAATPAGAAHFALSGGGIGTSPGRVSLTFPQPMRRDHPLVTLVSMIAPSPDWFVGVAGLSLLEDGVWLRSKTVTLYGYDAGTDSGARFTSPDLVTVPRGVIRRFNGYPAEANGVIVPFGTFTFTRLD